ncbi:hypothetical protein MKW94_024181 [Papaver nudicaule]|uniref:Uncharacterized protein n=1 Tax=Papaver nudicaule TaxID=74823 RepID=A0AA41VP81_PAPNU|nr:hypothetical protein [Papaver nudicaule]
MKEFVFLKSCQKEMVKPARGTTTLAFIFVAADSRASMGGYISHNLSRKSLKLTLGTMAGGAADSQFWHIYLCRLHELANKRRISVTGAAKLLADILYSYREMDLLYYADSEGRQLKGTRFSVGSSTIYYGGVACVYYVGPDGWKKISGDDHYSYYPVIPNAYL